MGKHWKDGGYSSEVEIYLLIDGVRHEVAQVGPHSLVLRDSCEFPSGYAQLIIIVDGKAEEHDIILASPEPSTQELAYAAR